MSRLGLIAGAAVVCCLALVALWPIGSEKQAHSPAPIEGAYVQLAFEDTLDTIGELDLTPQARDGDAVFSSGPTGRAYHAQGDGRYLEIRTPELGTLSEKVEISFDVMAEDWINPYAKSAPVKTVAVVSGKSGDRIRHIIFNLSANEKPVLTVSIEDVEGGKERLSSQPAAMTMDWHQVRLVVDRAGATSRLFLDDELVAETGVVPAIVKHGVDRVKIGTWHRQNQAFRGLVDNFVIRDASRQSS